MANNFLKFYQELAKLYTMFLCLNYILINLIVVTGKKSTIGTPVSGIKFLCQYVV